MMQLFAILFFAATIPSPAWWRSTAAQAMIWRTALRSLSVWPMPALFASGTIGAMMMLCLGFGLTGLVYGPRHGVLGDVSDIRELHREFDRL